MHRRRHDMRWFLIIAIVVLASGCSAPALDRSKAKSTLESKPWGSKQEVSFSFEQWQCGLNGGLWSREAWGNFKGGASVSPTDQGRNMGLGDLDINLDKTASTSLSPGFPVSIEVTGIAAQGDHALVEVNVVAKIAHACFTEPLQFLGNTGKALKFNFALFDDGWRVVK
jgi:hypothetical protein